MSVLNIRKVDAQLVEDLKIIAIKKNTSLRELVVDILSNYVDQERKEHHESRDSK